MLCCEIFRNIFLLNTYFFTVPVYTFLFKFFLYYYRYYMNLIKLINNYIDAAPDVFYTKAVLKNYALFTEKQLCWSLFLIKLQALRSATLLKRDFSTGVFLCILRISIYFEKHLRTAASDYSFTIVIYLFSAVSLQVRRKTTIFEIRRSLKLDYAIQDVWFEKVCQNSWKCHCK